MRSKQLCRKRIRTVLIVLSLMPFLNGCASEIVRTVTIREPVPESLLIACPITQPTKKTYQGGLELAEARGRDIKECNKRFEDIRKWSAP